MHNLAYKMV